MARQHRRSIRRFLSGLFGSCETSKASRSSRGNRASSRRNPAQHSQVSEELENRAMLTLIGVDFGGGTTPSNWNGFSGTADATLTDLQDDTGAASGIDLVINVDTTPGSNEAFTPPGSELPIYTSPLAGIDGAYTDIGNIELTFQDLNPGESYQLYIFAGDSFSGDQLVTISSPDTGTTITSFAQPHSADQLVINDQIGSSTQSLQTYGVDAAADSNGEIQIRIDNSNAPTSFFGLAGVAIESATVPTGLALNEIVADIPGGTDNPNEYVELRGPAGQSLNDVYLVFVEGSDQPTLGTIRPGNSGVVDLSAASIGANGHLAIVDDATDPYTIDPGAAILDLPGLDIGDAAYTAFLVYVDPATGTAPVASQDLDTGNDGLDVLPTGWTVLDGISVLDGATTSRGYAQTVFSPTADGLIEAGAELVATGFGGSINQVMRGGENMSPESPQVYEGFDYAPSGTDLQSQNGGIGFGGPWQSGGFNAVAGNAPLFDVLSGTLGAASLETEGGRVSVPSLPSIGGIRRTLQSPIGADGTTSYFSVLMEPQGTLGAGAFGGFFGIYLDSAIGDDLFAGAGNGNWGMGTRGGIGRVNTTVPAVIGETVLIVIKAEFLAGDDRFTFYLNPTPGGIEPSAGIIKQDLDLGFVDAVTIYSTGEYDLDEIRIGDSFESVTPSIDGVPADWVAFQLAENAPDFTVAQSTNPAYQAGAIVTNHVGATNPSFADPPTDSLAVSILATSINENGGSTTATVQRTSDTTNALLVNLMSDDTTEATVLGTVTIAAGQATSAPFTISAVDDALIDGTQVVTITASEASHTDGVASLEVIDDEALLSVAIAAASISEADGPGATTATVTRNTGSTGDLLVTLMSSDTTEATVLGTVLIPDGSTTSAPFSINAIDDQNVDGTQTVSITASAAGHGDGSSTVDVTDDDSAMLTLTLTTSLISEDGGSTTATVTRNTPTTSDLTVTVVSSDTSEAIVVGTVTIAAGQATSPVFAISGVDDTVADGTITVTLTASAAGHDDSTSNLNVSDNEAASLLVTISTAEISEADGSTAATFTVTRFSDVTNSLTVMVSTDDPTAATVPATVTIPAGQITSAPIPITAIDDAVVDGTQTVTILAEAVIEGAGDPASVLDQAFGVNGYAAFPTDGQGDSSHFAQQPDGRSIIAVLNSSQTSLDVTRLNTDGTLDTTFGTNGQTSIATIFGDPTTIRTQNDGKILIAGVGAKVIRLNADGTVDASFAANGIFDLGTQSLGNTVNDLAIRPDGRILVTYISGVSFFNFVQLNSNGSLDTSFGINGVVNDSGAPRWARSMHLLPDGGFLAAGGSGQVQVNKYLPDGSRDLTFGAGGAVNINVGSPTSSVQDLRVDSQGRIVVSGGQSIFAIYALRLLEDGSVDGTFGSGGVAVPGTTVGLRFEIEGQLTILANDQIILGANISVGGILGPYEAGLVRLNDDGTLDATFDDDGILTTPFPGAANSTQGMIEILTDSSGDIVSLIGSQDSYSLVRITAADALVQASSTLNVLDDDLGKWVPQGPAPTQNAQLEINTQPNRQVTGAIHTVLAHPTDPDILYIGAVNGGIWKTTDASSVNPTWIPLTDHLSAQSMGAMAFDESDPTHNTIVAGTAKYSSFAGFGGARGFVYRTTDGGDTWTELAASGLGPQNISGIAARGNEIVITSTAGNGGIFRSTNGGASFSGIASADFSVGDNFTDLVVDASDPTGQRLYAANESTGGPGGIYRSNNFGQSWTKITGPVIDATMESVLTESNNIEMTVHPTTGRLYVAVLVSSQPQGVFYSSNAGTSNPTWTQMDVPVLPIGTASAITGASNASPIEITSAGHGLSSNDFVVIDGVTGNTAANGFFRVTVTGANTFTLDASVGNGAYVSGGSWTQVTGPSPTAKDIDEITGAQGRIHFSIVVDPTNEDLLYIGGDRQDAPNAIGDSNFAGAIFKGDASIAANPNVVPSPQWDHITHDIVPSLDPDGGTANGTSPHADSREMVFDANGDLIEVDDGGIFRRTSPRDNTGDWFSLAGSLSVIEFHDIAYDDVLGVIIGGTQDNGTHLQLTSGGQLWDHVMGGDGAEVAVDTVTLAANNQSIRYMSSQNLGGFTRTIWDANNTEVSDVTPTMTVLAGGDAFIPQFKTPYVLNAVDPTRILLQGSNAIYESLDQADSITQVGGDSVPGGLQDALVYGGFQGGVANPDVFYVGVGDEIRVRTTAGGAVATVDPSTSFGDIRDVTMNSDDWSNAFAIDENQVFQTTDAGGTWGDITGNLASLGGDFRTMVYLANAAADAVLVGTSTGVYASFTSALGTWFELGEGLPNVSMFDLVYSATDDVLIGGTLGRGAWKLDNASEVLPATPDVMISDVTVSEADNAAIFTVTLATPAVNDVTLQLSTANGTALGGSDYTALTGTVAIPLGSSSGTFTVPIRADAVAELTETFTVSITGVLTGSVGSTTDTGTGTILDNDATIVLQIASATIAESDATTGTVTRNTPTTSALDVTLMSDDTSEATVLGTVTIPAGQTSVTFDIDAVEDFFVDGTQTVTITPVVSGHIATSDTVDVLDIDIPTLTIDVLADSVIETDGLAATTATVTRNTDATGPLVVTLLSSDAGEATVIGTVTIAAGQQTSAPFNLDAIDETLLDGNQTVTITGSAAGFQSGTDTIVVRDNETPVVTLSVDKQVTDEIDGEVITVTATLSFASTADSTIELAIAGSATGGSVDYNDPTTTQIFIPAGMESGSISFTIAGDTLDENNETIDISVLSLINVEQETPQAVSVTITDNDLPPAVTITAPATVNEGDVVTFNVATDEESDKVVTIDLAVGGVAVGGGVDYVDPTVLQVTIPVGMTSVDVNITTLLDGLSEANESLVLGAVGFVDALGGPNSIAITEIVSIDPPPSVRLSVDTTTVVENFGRAIFTATLSEVSGQDVVVDLLPGGTAVDGIDYDLSATQILIPAGSLSGLVTLTAQRDDLDEFDEEVTMSIQSASNAVPSGVQIQTTIVDADIEPTATLSVSAPSVAEDAGTVTFFVTLDNVSGKTVTANLLLDGEAIPGSDYTHTTLSVVIPAGSLTGSVVLTLTQDGLDEFDELAVLSFVDVTNAVENIVQQAATLIQDIDPLPTLTTSLVSANVAESGGIDGVFVVQLSQPSGKDVTVDLAISGTATSGVDYTGGATQVFIPAGDTSASVIVSVIDDNLDEFDETVVFTATNVVNATPSGALEQTLTIIDDEDLPVVSLSIDEAAIMEDGGQATVTATLSEVAGRQYVLLLSRTGLATAGADYQPTPAFITIAAGSLTGSVTFAAIDDALDEFDEDIIIGLLAPGPDAPTTNPLASSVTTTILDNDLLPTVDLSVDTATITEAGGQAVFTATLSEVSGRDVTISLAQGGAATGGGTDYVDPPTLIMIPAGSLTGSVNVLAVEDNLNEDDETVTLSIVSADFASPGTVVSQTTAIVDNDSLPTVGISVDNTTIAEAGGVSIITATLSELSGRDVIVDLQRTGNATPGDDFSGLASQITIPAGDLTATMTITAIDDNLVEPNETISLVSLATQNATFDGIARTITITDDDIATLTLTLSNALVNEADGLGATMLTVTRNTNTGISLPVTLTSSDTDEATVINSVIIPVGQTSVTVPVNAINDNILDGLQTVTLTGTSGGFVSGLVNLDVEDATTAINLSVDTNTASEDGQTVVTITATADKPVIGAQQLSLTASGVAFELTGNDYVLADTVLTFADGQTSATTTFTVVDDALVESLIETATIGMTNLTPGLAEGPTATQVISITDNDSAVISIDDVVVTEGDSGGTDAVFTVTLGTAVDVPITFLYATGDGTALSSDSDYVSDNGSVTFLGQAGETQTITISVTGDEKVELDQIFNVNLSGLTPANTNGRAVSFDRLSGSATITNDDSATVSVNDVTAIEGGSGMTAFEVTVSLDAEVDAPVTLDYTTADGTAFDGSDYTITSGSTAFTANAGGPDTLTLTVMVTGDETVELDETFLVNISNLMSGGRDVTIVDAQGVATIQNDDTAQLSIDSISQAEGDTGTSVFTFTVTLDSDVDVGLSLDVDTANGTATLGEDYVANTGTMLSFIGNAGETQTFDVVVMGDTKVEQDETFLANLSRVVASGRNVVIGQPQGIATILNDDSAEISISDAVLTEGDSGTQIATFTVTLDNEVASDVTLDFTTSALTASAADGDYDAVSGTLTFGSNTGSSQAANISVVINGDTKVELDETFALLLSNLTTNALDVTLADSQGLGTITNDDSASISISNVSSNEGTGGSTVFTFDVSLDAEVDVPLMIDYATSDGTALAADNDYTAVLGSTLTLAANTGGSQIQPIAISVAADSRVELDEIFLLTLSNLVADGRNITVADGQAAGTILNDDTATLSIANASITELDSGASDITFTVTLDAEVDTDISIDYDTFDDTASVARGDYLPNTGNSFTFAANTAGGQEQTFTVSVQGDEIVELDETFFANLTGLIADGRNVVLGQALAVGTIVNDDAATITISDVTLDEGNTGGTAFGFMVTLSGETDVPITVDFSTLDDTATTADADYTAVTGQQLVFAPNFTGGPQQLTQTVVVGGDRKLELNESFFADLTNLQASGRDITVADAQAVGTITNDDTANVTVSNATITEGNGGPRNLIFTVTLDAEVDTDVTVGYVVEDITAELGVDYETTASTDRLNPSLLTFAGNSGLPTQSQTITIPILGDNIVELDETLQVFLTGITDGGQGVNMAVDTGIGTIENDDNAVISINSVSAAEGDTTGNTLTFTVSLDNDVDMPITVNYGIVDGTAVRNVDYTIDDPTALIFDGTAGQTHTITVQTLPDSIVELDELFFIDLLSEDAVSDSVTFGDARGTGTITNDDTANISISDVSVVEGDTGSTAAVFTVTLAGNVDTAIQLGYSTVDSTATAGQDYTAGSGTLNLSGANGSTATFSIPVFGDNLVESDEAFFADLIDLVASGRNVVFSDARGVATIVNDDFINLSITGDSVAEGYQATGTTLRFVVTRENTTVPVTIDYTTVDGTATTADNDYVPVTGAITLPAGGSTTTEILVTVVGDHITELNETLSVVISSATPQVVFTNNSATGTIVQDDGSVSGQKWYDVNGDGVQDADEPGLNGWQIDLLDATGSVVSTTVTGNIDLNNDGSIDPLTEQGLYVLPANEGNWTIREVLRDGWRQTFPDSGDSLAYDLDQAFGLEFTGNLFENWGGLGEKWLRGSDQWYFITPAGNLFRWDNSARSNLTGDLVGALGGQFHASPSLLYNAQPNNLRSVVVTVGQDVGNMDFGNIPTGQIEGRKFHDVDADNVRDASEPWLNGWTITLTDSTGNVVGTAVTADLDRDGNGQIDPATETGWYRFSNLLPDTYSVSEETRTGWSQNGTSGLFVNEAYQLDQELNFNEPRNDFRNWGGRGERWLRGDTGWHFITPNGQFYKWDSSPRTALTGTLVATLDATYWQDLSLLYAAQPPASFEVQIDGQEVAGIDFANTFGHNGTGSGNVTVSVVNGNLQVTGDAAANTVVIYADNNGNSWVAGAGDTTVNGGQSPYAVRSVGNAAVDLGSEDDQLVIVGSAVDSANSISLETGAGNDLVAISDINTAAPLTISNTAGSDTREILSAQLANLTLTGGGTALIQRSSLNGNLTASSNGVSHLVVNQSTVAGLTNLSGSGGSDNFIASNSLFTGSFTAAGNEGHDLIALLNNSQFQSEVAIAGDGGNDTFGLRSQNTFNTPASIDGGSGTDNLATDGASTAPTTRRVESNNNSTLNNLIDLALSHFDDLLLDI